MQEDPTITMPPASPSGSSNSSKSREEVCSASESPLHLPAPGWGGHIRRPHWESVLDSLKGIDLTFPMEVLEDPILSIPLDKQSTMDGASKCWRSIPPTSESLLHQEPDGITWAICEECVTQIPLEIQHAIFFFHSLKGHIQDYAGYSIESKNITFRMDRKRPKVVTKLLWSMTDEIKAHDMGHQYVSENEDIDMTNEMQQRSVYQDGTMYREINPVKIRLAFTGAKFKTNEHNEKRVFAVLLVTFARNFDALEYIKEVFLREPGHSESNYQKKHDFYTEMKMIWKRMLRFVAFDNLGLNEARLGKPEDYLDNPGGVLGVDSLMNMFQIPLQIYGSLKKSISGGFQDLEIMGMPYLTFKRDDVTQDYLTYMHRYVNCLVKARRQVSKGIQQLAIKNSEKKKKNGGDLEDIEERNDLNQQEDSDGEDLVGGNKELFCTGGWPLETDEGTIVSWGLPKLPLYLQFEAEFTPDINSHFNYWIVDAGGPNGIPEVTKACLRFYLVSGEGGAAGAVVGAGDQVHWEHFLHDPRPANPSLVLKEFYGEKANPMSAVVVAGHLRSWWKSLSQDFLDMPDSSRDIAGLYEKYKRYLKSVILHHESSVSCNAYRSERVVQAMQIIQKLDWKSISHQGPDCIFKKMKEARNKLPFTRRHDHYQVANELFWRTWEELNLSFKMNSSNLSFLIEMMISQVFWMMGEHNETWAAYFQGIQIKSGNGHYKITTKEGVMDDQRKPNSSGMDWTHGRLSDLYQVILDRFGCSDPKQNLQTPINCLGWTPASIPLLTHATIVDGKIDTLPDSMIALRSIVTTEIRGNGTNIESLISNFPRNADGLDQLKLNTCDPENTNKRKARIQKKFHPLHIVALSSNCPARNEKDNEEYRTLGAVLHVLVPGSAGYVKRRKVGDFNNQVCNAFGGRQCRPDNIDSIANILSYSNIWISCMGALINKSAAIPWEINPAVLSYLDWLFFYVKEHCDGLLDKFVLQSFRRMKEGYESRQVAKSVWTCAIRDIALSPEGEKDHYQAVMNNLQSLHVHALPVSEVPASAHSFLTRGIHMGSTMMIGVCARHLDVPVLKTEDLQTFFAPKASSDDTPISDRERQCLRTLRQWIEMSSERFRFCVDETGQKTCYISSDADMYQNPLDDKICMLRVKKSRVYHDNVSQAIGVRVKDLFGSELNETCHMGPEPSIYGNAVQGLVQDWSWDFRQLYSNYMFHSQQHLIKLGLAGQFPGIQNWTENETPSFAKIFTTKDPHGEVMSYSLGIHVWSLLLFVSMGGSLLHPHATSNLSRAILKQILENAPESATPGNALLVRSFNIETTSPQRILLSSKKRPTHFVRAVGDLSFATTGKFTYGKDVDGFLPEDVMHNGFLFSMARMFGCHILDIPGHTVKAGYEIMANTVYACWKASERQLAYLKVQVNAQVQHVLLHNYETCQVYQFSLDEWEHKLKELDYTILPMIFRKGACLSVPSDPALLGVIVPYPGQEVQGGSENFNPEEGTYHYICGPTLEVKGIPCIQALTNLVQVGSVVYLDLTSDSARPLLPQLSASESQCQYLQARLSPPACLFPGNPAKVWITYMQKPLSVTASANASSCATIEVDPWEVRVRLPEHFQEGARVVAHAVYV